VENTVDFIIAGGGSAGCVLANRLTENPSNRVLLLEAGGSSDRFFVDMPAGINKLIGNPEVDWMHVTEPDPSIDNRRGLWFAGKMLGGGSAINGMVYIRGARHDYDGWAAAGCSGWSWNEVLPYFLKSEDFQGPASPTHARGGPLAVSPLRIRHPLADAFVTACTQAGLRRVEDYCAGEIDGTFVNLVTQKLGRRWSAAKGYLGPAAGRPNLTVMTGALVDRVLVENGRAVGVRFIRAGAPVEWRAAREVVVSGGSIHSPAILMRSGIGPAAQLQALGIGVHVDAPEVGKNLQEHASFPSSRFVTVPTYNAMRGSLAMLGHLWDYLVFGEGMLTTAPVHAMAYVRSRAEMPQPDIKLQFGPLAVNAAKRTMHERPGVTIFANVSPPASRGEIRLRSARPEDKPVIDHRLYGDPADVAALTSGLRQVERIFDAPALARYVVGRNLPPEPPRDDAEWAHYLRTYSGIGFHAVATCRMGSDARSVVDPTLRVRGLRGLRVIDASIMPVMPSANTNAPTIMVAEKGAALVLNEPASQY
jgi:choline dehydrogenase